MTERSFRPRLALPFTTLTGPDRVTLVAGEDHRYSLCGDGVESWLPALLARLDGTRPLEAVLEELPAELVPRARELAGRLREERVLVDGPPTGAHPARSHRIRARGEGPLPAKLQDGEAPELPDCDVLCQANLDYDAALVFGRGCLAAGKTWIWASSGPMARGYVGPVFLPDAGPCLACVLTHFRRLSPDPEVYDALMTHARQGGRIEPTPFPELALDVLAAIVRWKVSCLAEPLPPAAAYRLHVVEAGDLSVSTHRVFVDAECPDCGGHR